ncbi:PREDICTED: uncharacterized protein LOC105363369 [Ceratosolen solmsi marchali]|uniref:Uncharacterized protein LOC105363369 n=1 Tax=Ceratosolen solmsi marchali TaxID=326594 RepID=A0AAJ6YJW1_9HYME|nr:PREDICTED: uncharacterized protein LOC105363369 [Ceratosolen solmsi marchali]
MSRLSRTDALEDISAWGTTDVVALLRKNGVEEACWKAVEKRQIDGDELLHLTEGKLTLWKSDLTRPLIWSLWTFVEELKKYPENYVEDKQLQSQPIQQLDAEALSDTSSWDTDFEDNVDDHNDDCGMTRVREVTEVNPDFRSSLKLFQENDRIMMETHARGASYSINLNEKSNATPALECTYANYNMSIEQESTYANVGYANTTSRNSSKFHPTNEIDSISIEQKSLAEKLKEQLMLIGAKPAIVPKPEALCKRTKDELSLRRSEPRTSFLHKSVKSKINGTRDIERSSTLPSMGEQNQSVGGETMQNLPKPPAMIRCFDLVANLPRGPVDESEDEEEYEAFDEQIVEQHKRNSIIHADSGQSLSSVTQNSLESVYHPPTCVSHDEEVYEIYESITESPEENGHDFKNGTNIKIMTNPPPLPTKPPPNIMTLHNHLNKTDTKNERSLEKKSATLPSHSASKSSLSNAARPLPPPPDKQSYYERPWFHNLTREQANLLIEEQCTYGNSSDGYFLMRPSTSNPNNPLTLVLWCKDRVYNVPVRRRPDNRYALGSSKPNEQSFASIDEIIPFYKRENLVLYTGGVQTGSTKLSDTPLK